MSIETIEELLAAFDKAIEKRDSDLSRIDADYVDSNGNVRSSEYGEYKQRKDKATDDFNNNAITYQKNIDTLCKKIREAQPALDQLNDKNINIGGAFPRKIALGRLHVKYNEKDGDLDFYVPQMFDFPFKKPMYISEEDKDDHISLIHKILLRFMYSLPAEKQEYYVFDPIGLGKNVWKFNSLFNNEKIFPQKKVMTNSLELKEALKEVIEYMQSLYAGTFNMQMSCDNWDSYNRFLCSQNRAQKMLPYKVFIFFNVPDCMDKECFDMFKILISHGEECGVLVLYSFNKILLESDDNKYNALEMELKQCIDISSPLHKVLGKKLSEHSFTRLEVTSEGEHFPDGEKLTGLLSHFDDVIKKSQSSMFSFDEMLKDGDLFSQNALNGLSVPVGYSSSGGSETKIEVNDRNTHYLIGGTTGSGKSNLLHTIITSGCWNYSPEQLQVYLLDFKDGVEFSIYAKEGQILPHAALVATQADTEYGVSVLKHLVDVKTERYDLFKENNCKDITAYLKSSPTEAMPRILVIIDEFQVLFAGGQNAAADLINTIAKQGRACGIHLILATQSLKDIGFGNIASQFSGRIALKCSAQESDQILGGDQSTNGAASEIEVPFAILNTSQGRKAGNEKFAVPEAKYEFIEQKLKKIASESNSRGIKTKTNIFKGQSFPKADESVFHSDSKIVLTLGEALKYSSDKLRIPLERASENNVLICGHDKQMKSYFMKEVFHSAEGCKECDELIYIGDASDEYFKESNKLIKHTCLKEFIAATDFSAYDKKRIIIIDNINTDKEIGFPLPSYGTLREEAVKFNEFWENANKNGNYFVVFADGANKVKTFKLPTNDFRYLIGYSLNSSEIFDLLKDNNKQQAASQRAFLADNFEVKEWFRPYEL